MTEHGTSAGVGSVSVEDVGRVEVGEGEDSVMEHVVFEGVKSFLFDFGPPPGGGFVEEVSKWGHKCSERRDESMVESADTKKTADVADVTGCLPVRDHLKFVRHRADATRADNVSHEFDLGLREAALGVFNETFFRRKAGKDFLEVSEMLFEGVGEDDDVINVDVSEVTNIMKDLVH